MPAKELLGIWTGGCRGSGPGCRNDRGPCLQDDGVISRGSRRRRSYALASVCRTDLFPSLTASGQIAVWYRTVIECELENIVIGVLGQRLWVGGASVLLSIVPEGSVVHRGDVLAVLDASEYEELLRQQQITVERSRADHRQAELEYQNRPAGRPRISRRDHGRGYQGFRAERGTGRV